MTIGVTNKSINERVKQPPLSVKLAKHNLHGSVMRYEPGDRMRKSKQRIDQTNLKQYYQLKRLSLVQLSSQFIAGKMFTNSKALDFTN